MDRLNTQYPSGTQEFELTAFTVQAGNYTFQHLSPVPLWNSGRRALLGLWSAHLACLWADVKIIPSYAMN